MCLFGFFYRIIYLAVDAKETLVYSVKYQLFMKISFWPREAAVKYLKLIEFIFLKGTLSSVCRNVL